VENCFFKDFGNIIPFINLYHSYHLLINIPHISLEYILHTISQYCEKLRTIVAFNAGSAMKSFVRSSHSISVILWKVSRDHRIRMMNIRAIIIKCECDKLEGKGIRDVKLDIIYFVTLNISYRLTCCSFSKCKAIARLFASDNPPNGYDLGEVGWLSTLRT